MIIKNYTKWQTKDFRKLFGKCIEDVRKVEREGKNKGIMVEIKNSNTRGDSIWGRGWIGYYKIMIKIGTGVGFEQGLSLENRMRLAKVFIHEYYHNLGFSSQDHRDYKNDWTEDWNVDFVKDYPIRIAKIEPKPKRDLQMERYQKTLVYVKQYEGMSKRIKNLLRKWRQKRKYYENVLTAAGKIDIKK